MITFFHWFTGQVETLYSFILKFLSQIVSLIKKRIFHTFYMPGSFLSQNTFPVALHHKWNVSMFCQTIPKLTPLSGFHAHRPELPNSYVKTDYNAMLEISILIEFEISYHNSCSMYLRIITSMALKYILIINSYKFWFSFIATSLKLHKNQL